MGINLDEPKPLPIAVFYIVQDLSSDKKLAEGAGYPTLDQISRWIKDSSDGYVTITYERQP